MAHSGHGLTKEPFFMESGRLHGMERNVAKGNWHLGTGTGKRQWIETIKFEEPFVKPPAIFVSFSLLDLVVESDYRLKVKAKEITTTQFQLVVTTKKDTQVWSVAVSWFAYDWTKANTPGLMILCGREKFDTKSANWHKTEGPRNMVKDIQFLAGFTNKPRVLTALCEFDSSIEGEFILNSVPNSIDQYGFKLQLSTDKDAHVWSTHVAWIAIDDGFDSDMTLGGFLQLGNHNFQKGQPGYQLDYGKGSRDLVAHKQFTKNFSSKPTIIPLFSGINCKVEEEMDLRVTTEAGASNASSFELKLGTWNNSCVRGASCSYIAHGPQTPIIKPPKKPSTVVLDEPPLKKQKTVDTKIVDDEDDEGFCKICYEVKINAFG